MKRITTYLLILICIVSCEKDVFTGIAEPAIPEYSKIFVSSNPVGYKIFIDNKNWSVLTPDTVLYLTVGEHKLNLRHNYFSDTTVTITINKTIANSFFFDMMKNPRFYAKIYCSTIPSEAKVFINKVLINNIRTPTVIEKIYPGKYELKFSRKECRDDSLNVEVKGGQHLDIQRFLEDTTRVVSYRMNNSPMPSNILNKVVVDRYNNKWIGSIDHGLIKFDGKNWTSYENTGVIDGSRINDLLIDQKGKLWVGSVKGLFVFDGINWKAYTDKLPSINVVALEEDINGNMWIATLNEVIKYDNISFQVFTSSNTGVPLNNLSSLSSSKNGDIWIGSFTWGIMRFNGSKWTYYTNALMGFDSSISNEINDLIVDKNGNLYAFSAEDNGQLLRSALMKYNGSKWEEIRLPLLFQPDVYSFYNDDENNIWLSINGGLVKYNETKPLKDFDSDSNGFFSKLSSSFCIDYNGDGWLTTLGGGIVKLKKAFF